MAKVRNDSIMYRVSCNANLFYILKRKIAKQGGNIIQGS